jgi:hypothetical protein
VPASMAAPVVANVGGERLVLDTVPGITDALPLGSPRVVEFAESLTSASNRILLFGLTDADIRRFNAADPPDLKRYMLLVTPHHLVRERVTPEQFRMLIEDAQRDTGKPAEIKDYKEFMDERPHGQLAVLAQLKQAPDLYSVLVGTRAPGTGGWFSSTQYLISTNSFMLVRNKALSLSVYSNYDGPQDIEWIRFVTERWIETLQKLNAR